MKAMVQYPQKQRHGTKQDMTDIHQTSPRQSQAGICSHEWRAFKKGSRSSGGREFGLGSEHRDSAVCMTTAMAENTNRLETMSEQNNKDSTSDNWTPLLSSEVSIASPSTCTVGPSLASSIGVSGSSTSMGTSWL